MRLRVLIAPDKFKGTLTAHAAAKAMARGWRRGRPKDDVELLPISDGGDGFGAVMSELMGAAPRVVKSCDAAHRPARVRWWWEPGSKTAVIETAEVVGLAKLPVSRYHPFELDTYGLGNVLRAAAALGARRSLVGLGGSATNDGGFGLARALGWDFLNARGKPIERWTELPAAVRLNRPARHLRFDELAVAVDVRNPLLGPLGATRVYGPQKGLNQADFPVAESCLRRLAELVRRSTGRKLARRPGAGAAGGLGFGFMAFLGGRLEPGFELFAHEADLKRRLGAVDLVITGEGAIDDSTFMGKGAGCLAGLCRQLEVPCIGLAGVVSPNMAASSLFSEVLALTKLTTVAEAQRKPAKWLEEAARGIAGKAAGKLELGAKRRTV